MTNIQFDEEQQYQPAYQAKQNPFLVRLVLATRIVSTNTAAEYVLLGVATIVIVLAFMIPTLLGGSPTPTETDRERLLTAPAIGPNSHLPAPY